MKKALFLLFFCNLSFLAYAAQTARQYDYVRYFYDPFLKHIEISVEHGKLPAVFQTEAEAISTLDEKGIVLFAGSKKRSIAYNKKIGSYDVKTIVTLSPPGSKAAYLPEIALYVNDTKRLDAPIGTGETPYQIYLDRLSISENGIRAQAYSVFPTLLLPLPQFGLTGDTIVNNEMFSEIAKKTVKENCRP